MLEQWKILKGHSGIARPLIVEGRAEAVGLHLIKGTFCITLWNISCWNAFALTGRRRRFSGEAMKKRIERG